MIDCKDFLEINICPKGLRCNNRHDYNSGKLKDPYISKAFDIVFTYLFDERRERQNIVKELRDIKNLLSIKGGDHSNFSGTTKSAPINKALNKLVVIEERLSRLEGTIKTKGLPLRAADLAFNHKPLQFKHTDTSILGRGEAILGRSVMIKKNPNQSPRTKIGGRHEIKNINRGKVKKRSSNFTVTPQIENTIFSGPSGSNPINPESSLSPTNADPHLDQIYMEESLQHILNPVSPTSSITSGGSKGSTKKTSFFGGLTSKFNNKK